MYEELKVNLIHAIGEAIKIIDGVKGAINDIDGWDIRVPMGRNNKNRRGLLRKVIFCERFQKSPGGKVSSTDNVGDP